MLKRYKGICVAFVVIGLMLIGSTYIMRIYFENIAEKMLILAQAQEKLYGERSHDADHQKKEKAKKDDDRDDEVVIKDDGTVVMDTEVLGYINIKSHNIKSAIVEGVSSVELAVAVGHFPGTAMPGESGNFCLAGHSSMVKKMVFNELINAKKGEEIEISYKGKIYVYKITSVEVIQPTQTEILDQDKSIKEMTISTCANYGTKRRCVKALLDRVEEIEE